MDFIPCAECGLSFPSHRLKPIMILTKQGRKPARVCDYCLDILLKKTKEQQKEEENH